MRNAQGHLVPLELVKPIDQERDRLVRELVARGCTVVSVLHELSMALQADDVAVVAQGRLRHHGAAQDAATHRALEQVFDERIAIHSVAGQWLALPVLAASAPVL